MKSVIIAFSALFTLISCTKDNRALYTPDAPVPTDTLVITATDTVKHLFYLALGDSYTIGQSVPEASRYPVQTVKYFNNSGVHFDDPEIVAQTGWTTGDLLNKLALTPPSRSQYDIVSLLIGVNNQYQFRTQQEYAEQFLTLLNKAIEYAGNKRQRVIVLSIPDYSVTPFANGRDKALIAEQIDSFNLINRTIAAHAGVTYLDVTGFSRIAANNPELLAPDGLHYSGEEYKVWADALISIIKRVLQ